MKRPLAVLIACAASAFMSVEAMAEDNSCNGMVGVGGEWVMQPFGFDEAGSSGFIFARSFAEDYAKNGLMLGPSEKKVMGTPPAGETYLTLLVQGRINPEWKTDISWEMVTLQISNIVFSADGTKPEIGWFSETDNYAYLMKGNSKLAMTEGKLVVTIFQSGLSAFMGAMAQGEGEIRFCHGLKDDYENCLSLDVGNETAAAALATAQEVLRTRSKQFRESGTCG